MYKSGCAVLDTLQANEEFGRMAVKKAVAIIKS